MLDKKGQPHFAEYSSTVIKEGNKVVGTRGIVRDITDRKRLERQLIFSERMAAVGQIAAGVSHEFNSLIAGIKNSVEFAKKTKRKEGKKEATERILQYVDRGAKIAEDLLSFSRNIDQNEALIRVKNSIKRIRKLDDPSSQLNRQIGKNIRTLRKQKNVTIKELAKRIGLSVSSISQIENAKNAASVLSLYKIAQALDVEFSGLVENI